MFCNDIKSLMDELETKECRLFIDGSKTCLKTVLLYDNNKYLSIPVAYSTLKGKHTQKLNQYWTLYVYKMDLLSTVPLFACGTAELLISII